MSETPAMPSISSAESSSNSTPLPPPTQRISPQRPTTLAISASTSRMSLNIEAIDLTPIDENVNLLNAISPITLIDFTNIKLQKKRKSSRKELQQGDASSSDSNKSPLEFKDGEINREQSLAIMDAIVYRCAAPVQFKDVPMHLAMSRINVTFTGPCNKDLKERLIWMVNDMNGKVLASFTDCTTHMVASHGLTEKVLFARKKNVPLLTADWIHGVYNACQEDPYVYAGDDHILAFHALPLFFNVKVSISVELPPDIQRIVAQQVSKNGGQVFYKVEKGSCDVAICQYGWETDYAIALGLDIPSVTPAWVTVCVMENTIVDFQLHEVKTPQAPQANPYGKQLPPPEKLESITA